MWHEKQKIFLDIYTWTYLHHIHSEQAQLAFGQTVRISGWWGGAGGPLMTASLNGIIFTKQTTGMNILHFTMENKCQTNI